MAQFSEKQRDEIKKGFSLYDYDGDGEPFCRTFCLKKSFSTYRNRSLFFQLSFTFPGFITVRELGTLLRAMGQTPTNAEIQSLTAEVPEDGKISLDLFLDFLSRKVLVCCHTTSF